MNIINEEGKDERGIWHVLGRQEIRIKFLQKTWS
jgi:hypothetical protein